MTRDPSTGDLPHLQRMHRLRRIVAWGARGGARPRAHQSRVRRHAWQQCAGANAGLGRRELRGTASPACAARRLQPVAGHGGQTLGRPPGGRAREDQRHRAPHGIRRLARRPLVVHRSGRRPLHRRSQLQRRNTKEDDGHPPRRPSPGVLLFRRARRGFARAAEPFERNRTASDWSAIAGARPAAPRRVTGRMVIGGVLHRSQVAMQRRTGPPSSARWPAWRSAARSVARWTSRTGA